MILQDLIWPNGQDNDGGVGSEHYYALIDDVRTWPVIAPTPTNFTGKVTLTGSFVMKPGKKFQKIYCTLEKGMIASTQVGERDGKSYETIATLHFPGNTPEMIGFLEHLKNSNIVLVVRELMGTQRVLGSQYLPANIETSAVTTGTAVADLKGATFTVRSIGRIAPIFTGSVPLEPAPPDPIPPVVP